MRIDGNQDRIGSATELHAGCRIDWAVRPRTELAKVAEGALRPGATGTARAGHQAALGARRYGSVVRLSDMIAPPFLREEKESLGPIPVVVPRDKYGTADRVAPIVLLVRRHVRQEVIASVKCVVADKLVRVAVECTRAGLGLNLDRARTIAAVLRSVIRTEDADFGDRIQTRESHQRGVAAIVHVIAAVDFPVVVFGAAPIDAVHH